MSIFIAWGNTQQPCPLDNIPLELLTKRLRKPPPQPIRLLKRYRCRWLAHFLLYELLKTANISTALLKQIHYTENHRPQFINPQIDFNISHSEDWVAVILKVGKNQSTVGIDIEFPQKERDYNTLLKHFSNIQELEWFTKQSDKQSAFYRIWCLREALLKSQGVGIAKLSEVEHQVDNFFLYSNHCPQGEAIFTNELPFYLAFFANDKINDIHYFSWNGEQLQQMQLKQLLRYRVNY